MHGIDTHLVTDVATLLLAVWSGAAGTYRRLLTRLEAVEKATATHEGCLKAAKLL